MSHAPDMPDLPTSGAHCDEEYSLPCAEALLAGTLALMTGYVQACCDSHRDALRRKIAANLPLLAAPDIRERFAAARAAGKRAKDAAESLGLSEGAAVAAHAGEHGHPLKAQPLQGSWLELLQSLEACGPLMALTRNEGTVHEKTSVYTHVSATGPVGIALGEDIDLR